MFVDIEPVGFTMDPSRLDALLESSCHYDKDRHGLVHKPTGTLVKAVVPVHLYGQCAAMNDILPIARRRGLAVVEDACQAIGAKHGDSFAGAMGELGCFSFFPSKNLGGAGDGGMVVTGDRDLGLRVRLLRNHGMQPKYYHSFVGFNSRLDEIQAAVLRVKLPHLEDWSAGRRRNAAAYDSALAAAGVSGSIQTPRVLSGNLHIFHQYVIRCTKRDELRAALQKRGIGTEVYYPVALHQQECFRDLGYDDEAFPHSTAAAAQTLALPIYPELTSAQIDHVVGSIAEFMRET